MGKVYLRRFEDFGKDNLFSFKFLLVFCFFCVFRGIMSVLGDVS